MLQLKDKNLLNEGYINNLRNELQKKYLIDPFFNNLDNPNIKVMEAPTGMGKSWAIFNVISPTFLEKGGSIHIHTAPHTETINEREIEAYVADAFNTREFTPLVIYNGMEIDWTYIRQSLLNRRKVILILSDSKLRHLMEEDNSPIEMIVSDYGSEVLLTRDEMSWGTTSSPENYRNNQGYSGNKYRGTYIRNLVRLHKLGANFTGFTATPTREHKGELETDFGKDIQIINQWPEKHELILLQKWIRVMETRNYTTDDYWDTSILRKEIKWLSDRIEWREREIQDILTNTNLVDTDKFTGIISLQTRYMEKEDRLTVETLLEALREHPHLLNPEYNIIVTTADGWKEYDYRGDETFEGGKGDGWLTLMNSNTSKARIVVVIMKGNYGINIPTLCAGVALRNPNPKTKDTRQMILTSGIQFIGRLNRSNLSNQAWKNIRTLSNEYGAEKAYLYMDARNTFDFHAPSGHNGYWKEVMETFKDKYCNNFGEAYSRIWDFGME